MAFLVGRWLRPHPLWPSLCPRRRRRQSGTATRPILTCVSRRTRLTWTAATFLIGAFACCRLIRTGLTATAMGWGASVRNFAIKTVHW